jgi:hypothetical protein
LRERKLQDPADGRGVDRHSRRAQTTVEQNLRECPTERMTDEDRSPVEPADERVVMVNDLGDTKVLDDGGVATQGCEVLHAGPALGDHVEALVRIARDPVLPAQRCHE